MRSFRRVVRLHRVVVLALLVMVAASTGTAKMQIGGGGPPPPRSHFQTNGRVLQMMTPPAVPPCGGIGSSPTPSNP